MASATIRNLVKTISAIQSKMDLPAIRGASRDAQAYLALTRGLADDIHQAVLSADRILQKRKENPGSLGIRTRRAYQWLKHLDRDQNLADHLDALQRINLFLPMVNRKKAYRRQRVDFHFYHLGSLFKVSGNSSSILITAQEVLAHAPDQVLVAILRKSLNGEFPGDKKAIQDYLSSREYNTAREKLEYLGITKGSLAAGRSHDLRASFQRVNQAYFEGSLPEPHLVWSSRLTRRKFGHYQWDIDTVMVSRSLDHTSIPVYVVDFVMYHELLHKKIGAKYVNQRRAVHTAAFREQESRFKNVDRAQRWLNKIAAKRK